MTKSLSSPAEHLEPNARAACLNKMQRAGGRQRHVDDDASGLRTRRGAPVLNPYPDGSAVREVGDANECSERVERMSRDHRTMVKPHTTCSHPLVELAPVVRGESFPHLETARRAHFWPRWM